MSTLARTRRLESTRNRVYLAALAVWAEWLRSFGTAGRSTATASALMRQAHAMEIRSTTPGVYSNPTLSQILAMERSAWSAAASVDAIVMGLPEDQRIAVLGQALGYPQATVAEAIGCARRTVSDIQARARAAVIPRLLLTAAVVREMNDLHGLNLAPPAHSGIAGVVA